MRDRRKRIMAKISILGLADTRAMVLCIARGFMIDGKTAIVTDDTSYKRLMARDYDYAGKEVFGRLEDIDIIVDVNLKDKVNGTSIDQYLNTTLSGMGETYKNIVFVSDEVFDRTNGFTVICKGNEDNFDAAIKKCKVVADAVKEEKEYQANKDKPDALKSNAIQVIEVEIKQATKSKEADSNNVIRLSGTDLQWILGVEETKKLDVISNQQLINKIDGLVGEGCGMGNGRLAQLIARSYIAD